MVYLDFDTPNVPLRNEAGDGTVHVFDEHTVNAINTALAVKRPLLVRGEPGIGKTELARAAAMALGRAYVSYAVDIHTEPRDLQWELDSVARLADAQAGQSVEPVHEDGGAGQAASRGGGRAIPLRKYLVPGPLWWAYQWDHAARVAREAGRGAPPVPEGCHPANGVVVLIDEIDKADASVPNGLLEALGAGQFQPQGLDEPVVGGDPKPLVVITSNEERALPDAFVRRCLTLFLTFPRERQKRIKFLVERAKSNRQVFRMLKTEHFKQAAEMLVDDRETAERHHWTPLPGQAEFFDMLRGLDGLAGVNGYSVDELMGRIRQFTYRKHPWPDADEGAR